jgi:hypothetical protein
VAERKTRYNELLGVPNHIKDPDLYQLLGLERETFDPSKLEEVYRERMGAIQKIRSPKHKSFIEFLKGELRRARSTLNNDKKRQEYDQELFEERREQLQLILDVVLANNVLSPAEEERIHAAGGDVGLNADEVNQIVDEELAKRGASRGAGSDMAAPPLAAAPPPQAAPSAQTLPPGTLPPQTQTLPPQPQQAAPGGGGAAPLGVLQALGMGGGPGLAPPPGQQPGAPSYLPPPGQQQPGALPGFMPQPGGQMPGLAPPGGGFVPPPLAPSIHAPAGGMPGLAPSIHAPQPVVVGVCTGCMAPVNESDVQQRKAEQFPDGRLHCAGCVTRLVAGLMCAVCYGAVTRAETKQKQVVIAMIKAQQQKRAIHTRCLPQGAKPTQQAAQAQRATRPSDITQTTRVRRLSKGSGTWGEFSQLVKQDHVAGTPLMEGDLQRLPLTELISFLSFSKKSGEVVIKAGTGVAKVWLRDGNVCHATVGRHSGEGAFLALTDLKTGHFEFYDDRPPQGDSIRKPAMSLLMDAARRQDELAMKKPQAQPGPAKAASPKKTASGRQPKAAPEKPAKKKSKFKAPAPRKKRFR